MPESEKLRTDVAGVRGFVATRGPRSGLSELSAALERGTRVAGAANARRVERLGQEFATRLAANPELSADDLAAQDPRFAGIPQAARHTLAKRRDTEAQFNDFAAAQARAIATSPNASNPEALARDLHEARARFLEQNPEIAEDADSLVTFDDKFAAFRQNRVDRAIAGVEATTAEFSREALGRAIFSEAALNATNGDINFVGVADIMREAQDVDRRVAPAQRQADQRTMTTALIAQAGQMGSAGLRLLEVGVANMDDPDLKAQLINARHTLRANLEGALDDKAKAHAAQLKLRNAAAWEQAGVLRARGDATPEQIKALEDEIGITAGSTAQSEVTNLRKFLAGDDTGRAAEDNLELRARYEADIRNGQTTFATALNDPRLSPKDVESLAALATKGPDLLSIPAINDQVKFIEKTMAEADKRPSNIRASDVPFIMSAIRQEISAFSSTPEGRRLLRPENRAEALEVVRRRVREVQQEISQAINRLPPAAIAATATADQILAREAEIDRELQEVREEALLKRQAAGLGLSSDTSPWSVVVPSP